MIIQATFLKFDIHNKCFVMQNIQAIESFKGAEVEKTGEARTYVVLEDLQSYHFVPLDILHLR